MSPEELKTMEKNSPQALVLMDFFNGVERTKGVNTNARVHDVAQRLSGMLTKEQWKVTENMVVFMARAVGVRCENGVLGISAMPKGYAAVKKNLKDGFLP